MIAENFTAELTAFVSSLIEGAPYKSSDEWTMKLKSKIKVLVEEYWSKPMQFIVGDASADGDEISITSNAQAETNECSEISHLEAQQAIDFHAPLSNDNVDQNSANHRHSNVENDLKSGKLKHRDLEKKFKTHEAVKIRRKYLSDVLSVKASAIGNIPFEHYNYEQVKDACCENVIGYIPLPLGFAGPLNFDNSLLPIPLSTTEGALVASVSRGCKAINNSIARGNKLTVIVYADAMTRAPVLKFKSVTEALQCIKWVKENFSELKKCFDNRNISRFLNLTSIEPTLISHYLYLRFSATTGDAMGMNMITNATSECLKKIKEQFPSIRLSAISGNMCVDKKPSAVNWLKGRGKSVISEIEIPSDVMLSVFRTSVDSIIELAQAKLNVGTSTSITIGGWNAHAANVVAAMFLATGQDAAQVVSSSMCLTDLSKSPDGSLIATCTMPCLEVGTVGGGTILLPQHSVLEMLGCCDYSSKRLPGDNAKRLAKIICATVMAGELSLLASQCNDGELERSHMRLNRSQQNLPQMATSHNHVSSPISSRLPALSTVADVAPVADSLPIPNLEVPVLPNRSRSGSHVKERIKDSVKHHGCNLA